MYYGLASILDKTLGTQNAVVCTIYLLRIDKNFEDYLRNRMDLVRKTPVTRKAVVTVSPLPSVQ